MMTAWLLQNAAVATAFGAVVFIVTTLFRLRAPVRYGLWLLVMLRFVTPPVVSWNLSSDGVAARTTERLTSVLQTVSLTPTPSRPHPTAGGETIAARTSNRDIVGMDWIPATVLTLWLAGGVVLSLVYIRRYRAFLRTTRDRRGVPQVVLATVEQLAERIRVRAPLITIADGLAGPVLAGVFRPTLLWPRAFHVGLEANQLRAVITHELAHIRRRDHMRGIVEMAVAVVWWWYPVFWLVRRRVRDAAEQACDAWAVRVAGVTPREYADMLLDIAERRSPYRHTPLFAQHAFSSGSVMQRRLEEIVRGNHPNLTRPGVGAVALLAAFVLPAWTVSDLPDARVSIPVEYATQTAFAGVFGRGDITLGSADGSPVLLGPDSWFFAFEYEADGTASLRYEAVRKRGATRTSFVVDGRPAAHGAHVGAEIVHRVNQLMADVGYTPLPNSVLAHGGTIVSTGFHHVAQACGQTIAGWTSGTLPGPGAPGESLRKPGFVGVFVQQADPGTPVRLFEVIGRGAESAQVTLSRNGVSAAVTGEEQLLLNEVAECVSQSVAAARERGS